MRYRNKNPPDRNYVHNLFWALPLESALFCHVFQSVLYMSLYGLAKLIGALTLSTKRPLFLVSRAWREELFPALPRASIPPLSRHFATRSRDHDSRMKGSSWSVFKWIFCTRVKKRFEEWTVLMLPQCKECLSYTKSANWLILAYSSNKGLLRSRRGEKPDISDLLGFLV